jgi:hypothetical protein
VKSLAAKDAREAKEKVQLHRQGHKGRGEKEKLYREGNNNKDKGKT